MKEEKWNKYDFEHPFSKCKMFNSIMKIQIALLIWIHDILHCYKIYHVFLYIFPLSLWGDVAIFLFWFGWGFVELVDIVACVFHDTAWTLVKPQWRLLTAFGGGRGRIQSNLVRIHLDLSFRVVFSRIWGVSSWVWVQSRIY